MTQSQTMTMIKDVEDGTEIAVDNWCIFNERDEEKDKDVTIMTIQSGEEIYATQSGTFMDSIQVIEDIMGDDPYSIIKLSGETKANRPYVNCELA